MNGGDRAAFLRSKKAELNGIVTSRKRKLRELFAVSENELQLPTFSFKNPDVPPVSAAEARFLEVTDILQDRFFDVSNLPTRRQLRSDTSKSRSPIRKDSSTGRPIDVSRQEKHLQRDGSKPRKSRTPTPSARSDECLTIPAQNGVEAAAEQGILRQRSSSKSSQTDLPAESSSLLNEIVEETFENATRPRGSVSDATIPEQDVESDRIHKHVESRPNSPGVDPRQAMPISPEDAANLKEPLVQGLGSHDGQHKAVTAHLPPQEVQEARLRERAQRQKERDGHLSIHLPPRDAAKHMDALSSPGSTIDAQSATTPAMHEPSADTSPENDSSRYEVERVEGKEDDIPTPPELKHAPEEIAEKARHDRLLLGQMDASRAQIMKDSPRVGDVESSNATDGNGDSRMDDAASDGGQSRTEDLSTQEATEAVDDAMEGRQETADIPNEHGQRALEPQSETQLPAEIADSEAEATPPAEAMDIDSGTVKDSFESTSTTEGRTTVASVAVEAGEPSNESNVESTSSSATAGAPISRQTPPVPALPEVSRPSGRTTRLGSGAISRVHVTELTGEGSKPSSSSASARGDSDPRNSSSRSATPQSPRRSFIEEARKKKLTNLSTVIFPGRPPKPSHDPSRAENELTSAKDDYFIPLFLATSGTEKRGGPTLENLLATAHKTITTANAYVPIHENQTAKILKRIYNLQVSNKWSLRQPKRSIEVVRPTTHWDVLLQEAKWMRTDFREERKWKMTVARNLAYACAEWVESGPEDRKLLQVKATPPPVGDVPKDVEMCDRSSQAAHPTPDLVASGDSSMDDLDEEPRLDLQATVSPTAIFGLQDDDVVFGLRRSPTTDKLLSELPMYGTPLMIPDSDLPTTKPDLDPDRFWKRPALPLSKFVEGRLELKVDPPPRKKSRYEYELEDDDGCRVVFGQHQEIFGQQRDKVPVLPPENTNVALFDPLHKHIRERIHTSHQFRPPSEFAMPPQSFYENRIGSQWTWDEDNELKSYVQKYSYNWGLISSLLTTKSLFASGAERRTPWECFERWVQTEGMPADMQRTHYFRLYTNRIEQANRNVLASQQAAPPQPNANGQVQPPLRRRPTNSVRVDRRRAQKHLTLVGAMGKLAKKRETNLQKQQHAAGMAAMRKANEVPHVTNRQMPATTPQDFSRLKYEREEQFKERLVQMQQRQDQQRRLAEMQRRNAQNPQAGLPNGGPPRPTTSSGMAPNGNPSSNQNLTVPGQNRPPPRSMPQIPGQPMPNGFRVPQMPMNGVPPAPMQGQLPLPNPALDVSLVTRAHQISQNQQAILRQQQGQLPGQSPQLHNSPPRANGVPQPGFPMQNMMPPFNPNGNVVGTPPAIPHIQSPGGQAGSPRMGQHASMVPNNVPHVKVLEQQIMQKFPHATPDQVMRLISEQLAKSVQHQQRQGIAQSAMNAAAGGASGNGMTANNSMGMNGMGASQGTPQLYAQRLRQQQENQQKAQQAQMQAASAIGNSQQASGQVNSNTGNAGQSHAHRGSPTNGQGGN